MSEPLEDLNWRSEYPPDLPGEKDLPYDDGEPMESERHRKQMNLLLESLGYAWRARSDYFAGGNMGVYFSPAQVKNNDFRAPDVFVVLNTVLRERKSWVVWEERGRTPDVVIELLSESTEAIDRGKKKELYAKALRVTAYYLYDPWTYLLEGYVLDAKTGEYTPLAMDQDGYLPCSPLGLRLAVLEGTYQSYSNPWLRWIGDEGLLLTEGEVARKAEKKADEWERHAIEEKKRADEEKKRADEEKKRADEEKKHAEALKARLEELGIEY